MKFFRQEYIKRIREGFYSAVYFNRTQQILVSEHNLTPVTMQIFQKQSNQTLCGIEEVVELFSECAGFFEKKTFIKKFGELKIEALKDGEVIGEWEPVMHITGPYTYFAHLESVYLGILARRTRIATNTKHVVEAAGKKPVIFFADRFDYFLNQEGDGYAAKVGGVTGVATDAQASWFGEKGIGTIPHALIAVNNGNTVKAAEQFARHYPKVPLIVLVDFDNDCVGTSLEVAKALGDKLYGVRLDTSEKLIDTSLQNDLTEGVTGAGDPRRAPGALAKPSDGGGSRQDPEVIGPQNGTAASQPAGRDPEIHGVNPRLVKNVREALNAHGFEKVKIVVSGGFNEEKIKKFEQEHTPVDIYGVGSALVQGHAEFTADIVKVNGQEVAKFGRKFSSSKKLQAIDTK